MKAAAPRPPVRTPRPTREPNGIEQLLDVMARLRSPTGCPWDREQDHRSIRFHAVEEVYELIDAIEAGDDHEMAEELGDLLLQVVFHCQLGRERKAFDFDFVARRIVEKLIRRHPHVFGDTKVKDVDQVWANWERIKREEKRGTVHERPSALDGIPRHLPALLRAQKLAKKARKAGLAPAARPSPGTAEVPVTRRSLGGLLYDLASHCHEKGWSAEELLRGEILRRERQFRKAERVLVAASSKASPRKPKL
jgi:NTP pyrophosphatase (non-canonical NTP hydrolase)